MITSIMVFIGEKANQRKNQTNADIDVIAEYISSSIDEKRAVNTMKRLLFYW